MVSASAFLLAGALTTVASATSAPTASPTSFVPSGWSNLTYDCFGGDLQKVKGGYAACITACDSRNDCAGFSKHKSQDLCWLKSEATCLTNPVYGSDFYYVFRVPLFNQLAGDCPNQPVVLNTNVTASTYNEALSLCQAECAKANECEGVSFSYNGTGICTLRNSTCQATDNGSFTFYQKAGFTTAAPTSTITSTPTAAPSATASPTMAPTVTMSPTVFDQYERMTFQCTGGDLVTKKQSTLADCKAHCDAEPLCTGFTRWNDERDKCILKQSSNCQSQPDYASRFYFVARMPFFIPLNGDCTSGTVIYERTVLATTEAQALTGCKRECGIETACAGMSFQFNGTAGLCSLRSSTCLGQNIDTNSSSVFYEVIGFTRAPTASPTKSPTITTSPTVSPVTSSPVIPTISPSSAPVTGSPTSTPVTSAPTSFDSTPTPTTQPTLAPTFKPYDLEMIFTSISIQDIPSGSSQETQFINEFKAAVASSGPTINSSDVTIQSIQAGSVVVQSQVRIDSNEERQQLQSALSTPENVFSSGNGFNTALYGVPSLITVAPTAAPTLPDVVDDPTILGAQTRLFLILGAVVIFVFLASIVACLVWRRRARQAPTISRRPSRVKEIEVLATMTKGSTAAINEWEVVFAADKLNKQDSVPQLHKNDSTLAMEGLEDV